MPITTPVDIKHSACDPLGPGDVGLSHKDQVIWLNVTFRCQPFRSERQERCVLSVKPFPELARELLDCSPTLA